MNHETSLSPVRDSPLSFRERPSLPHETVIPPRRHFRDGIFPLAAHWRESTDHTAVDGEDLACYVGGIVRREEHGGFCDILRRAEAF